MAITPQKIIRASVRAAVYGAVALVDPNRLSGARKHAFWLGLAGASAAETALLPRPDDPWRPPAEVVGEGMFAAGLTYGGHELWAKADAWLIDALATAGARRPRLWYAALSAAIGAGVSLIEVPSIADEFGSDQEPTVVSDEVRDVVRGLLNGVQGYGADELFAQLATAQMTGGDGAWDFQVDENLPRTLISDYTFPVVGTYSSDGVEFTVLLDVVEGRLGSLYVLNDDVTGVDEAGVSLPDTASIDFHLEHART